jgi:PadR family transcriptional regulator, regulatory protein PadR
MTRARRPSPQTIAVLDALAARASDWSHGYDLCRMLGLKAGTVYPILMRLADRGLVETAWEEDPPPGRPPRHLYRLSDAGAEHVRGLPRPEPAPRRAGRPGVAGRLATGGAALPEVGS